MATPQDVMKMVKENDAKFVDFRFTDTRGKEQHVTVPVSAFSEDKFENGHAFDGSSIAGWKGIQASDMQLMPDPATAYVDPFFDETTVVLTCDVVDPADGRGYDRDPRSIAKRAEASHDRIDTEVKSKIRIFADSEVTNAFIRGIDFNLERRLYGGFSMMMHGLVDEVVDLDRPSGLHGEDDGLALAAGLAGASISSFFLPGLPSVVWLALLWSLEAFGWVMAYYQLPKLVVTTLSKFGVGITSVGLIVAAAFLVGAYQEILGDLHNLFGDTDAVHVRIDGDDYRVEHVVEGDSVAEVLSYVQYNKEDLVSRVRRAVEAVQQSLMREVPHDAGADAAAPAGG